MKNLGLGAIFKQAQKLQEDISRIKQELASMKVIGSSGGGMVEVTANGRQQILNIKIEKDVINPDDSEMLEELIAAAVNQALERSSELANEEMSKATGGILSNMPEGLKIPGIGL
ncbi:MAG: YbaB/EbfC family nucleoid-associated protein [bacterium]|jgi:DNA-binding YbaB/EbfC family protein|nr:YbaB/EbfC family nucleoid-associated protein [candidate division KSB1 bacterium]MCU0642931.1 YbaB/EbfC family nucleoid-associated protein [bacterium]